MDAEPEQGIIEQRGMVRRIMPKDDDETIEERQYRLKPDREANIPVYRRLAAAHLPLRRAN